MKQAPKFGIDQFAVIRETQTVFKIAGVVRHHETFKYLDAKGSHYDESELDHLPNQKPSFVFAPAPTKMFAYLNLRTTKIDHYEYEWAGNQFARRAPEHDLERQA